NASTGVKAEISNGLLQRLGLPTKTAPFGIFHRCRRSIEMRSGIGHSRSVRLSSGYIAPPIRDSGFFAFFSPGWQRLSLYFLDPPRLVPGMIRMHGIALDIAADGSSIASMDPSVAAVT